MIRKLLVSLVVLAVVGPTVPVPVEAQPSPPATFSGSATIDGKPVADGTAIRAFIGDQDCTQPGAIGTVSQGAKALYQIQVQAVSQTAGCGTDGSRVTFTIGGNPAAETSTWKPALQPIDLTAGTGTPGPGPTSTPAPPATSPNATATVPGTQATANPPPLIRVGSGTPETAVLTSDSPAVEKPSTSSRPNAAVLGASAVGAVAAGAVIMWRYRKGRRKI